MREVLSIAAGFGGAITFGALAAVTEKAFGTGVAWLVCVGGALTVVALIHLAALREEKS